MRFWWPDWEPRERSLSDDSECSTASHSSLASDASFYDASSDAETGLAGDPETAVSTGMGAETAVHDPSTVESGSDQVLGTDWSERENVIFTPLLPPFSSADGARVAPRALQQLCNDASADAAISGTCSQHATPIARQASSRAETYSDQDQSRSSASTLRRFGDREGVSRHPSLSLGSLVTATDPAHTNSVVGDPILGLSIGGGDPHNAPAVAADGTLAPILGLSIGAAVSREQRHGQASRAAPVADTPTAGPHRAPRPSPAPPRAPVGLPSVPACPCARRRRPGPPDVWFSTRQGGRHAARGGSGAGRARRSEQRLPGLADV